MREKDSWGVTGWYLEEHGVPPLPIPETETQKEGARLLSLDNIMSIFEQPDDEDDLPGAASFPERT